MDLAQNQWTPEAITMVDYTFDDVVYNIQCLLVGTCSTHFDLGFHLSRHLLAFESRKANYPPYH